MSKKTSCWGLEVGAYAIKGVRLTVDPQGEVHLAEYDVLPFKKVLSTPDLNVDEAIQLGLDEFLSRHDMSKSSVVVTVPGHMAFARFAKLPPVEPKKVPSIVEFEARQQIPFPIDQVEWDYQVFAQEDSPDVEVGIFAITKDRVNQFLSNYRAVRLHVDGLTLSPLAAYNAMAFDMELTPENEGVVLMDIGTTSTDVVIVEAGRIWLRTLPIGGNNFTEALVRAFKLSFPKAEKLKREAATSKYARQIFQAMRPVFADLVQEIQRSLGFYQALNRDAKLTRLVGLGSTFRLPGLQKFLKQQLQIEAERPMAADGKQQGFRRIAAEGAQAADFAEQTINLATAYGAALQGLGKAHVVANILPAQVLRQRMWRAKQPWFAGAALALIVAAGLSLWTLLHDQEADAAPAQQNAGEATRAFQEAEALVREYKNVQQADPRAQLQEDMRLLLYRRTAAMLLADLSQAAEAVCGQRVLLGNDYKLIRDIPRSQRKRLYIESYDLEYLSRLTPEGWADAKSGPVPVPESKIDDAVSGVGAGAAIGDVSPTQPRAFLVTIHGYVTYSQAYRLLTTDFINEVAKQANRLDRPYTLDINPNRIQIAQPYSNEPDPPAPKPASWDEKQWDRFLPERPLYVDDGRDWKPESRKNDWVFTIQWLVKLKTPSEIEKDEARALAPPSPPAPAPVRPTNKPPTTPVPVTPATRPASR